jgi:hypothetical protein
VLVTQPALPEDTQEEYVSKAERNVLVEKPLPGAEGKMISINLFKLPANT